MKISLVVLGVKSVKFEQFSNVNNVIPGKIPAEDGKTSLVYINKSLFPENVRNNKKINTANVDMFTA